MSLERWQNLLVSQFRFEISQWKRANQKGKSIWFYRMLIFGEQYLQKAGLWNGQLSCIGTKEISSVGEQRSFNCADKGKRRGPWESRHLTNSKIIQYLLRISEVWVYFADSAQTEYCTTFPLSVCVFVTGVTSHISHIYKVNRCLARYSPRATTTNRPTTGHCISLHGLAHINQKCQFWVKFGRFWAKNPFFLLEKS